MIHIVVVLVVGVVSFVVVVSPGVCSRYFWETQGNELSGNLHQGRTRRVKDVMIKL